MMSPQPAPHPTSPGGIVALEIPLSDPVAVYARLAHLPRPFLLDGGAADVTRARYSYVGADPHAWVECAHGIVTVDGQPAGADALGTLAALLQAGRDRLGNAPPPADLPPFRGGAVGFLGYELGGQLEALPAPRAEGVALPDMAVGFYDRIVAIDHAAGRAWVLCLAGPDAPERVREWRDLLAAPAAPVAAGEGPWLAAPGWRAGWSRESHEAAVARTVDYIAAGDIYQANITQRFLGTLAAGVAPLDLYLRLRARAAAPFSALLDLGPKGGTPAPWCPCRPNASWRLTRRGGWRRGPLRARDRAIPIPPGTPRWRRNCWPRPRTGRKT
ncbi:chorismate-binding protein [Nitrospirillum sp. BR 11164]|uniref:chorismate-binding protein n=1 Tax=Nitrospirillum sp. BR 11164 TaxID=3104324 RepID=UPI002AFE06EF|nr:chorismate-binding protein [Nitrospirillum sp. BR 11164]MEA1651483.1 chorismate-binding protein [Nitrospirillum sp. BR 11164]